MERVQEEKGRIMNHCRLARDRDTERYVHYLIAELQHDWLFSQRCSGAATRRHLEVGVFVLRIYSIRLRRYIACIYVHTNEESYKHLDFPLHRSHANGSISLSWKSNVTMMNRSTNDDVNIQLTELKCILENKLCHDYQFLGLHYNFKFFFATST